MRFAIFLQTAFHFQNIESKISPHPTSTCCSVSLTCFGVLFARVAVWIRSTEYQRICLGQVIVTYRIY